MANKTSTKKDKNLIWHPFTNLDEWEDEDILVITKGKGNYLYDHKGKRYLDANASLWCNLLGHNNKLINKHINNQLNKVAHTTFLGLTHEPAIRLSEELIRLMPHRNYRIFYSNSGAESVEVSLKMCYQYFQLKEKGSKRDTFISLRNGYHGDTLGAVSAGGINLFHKIFKKLTFRTIQFDNPYFYRCTKKSATHEECAKHCIRELKQVMRKVGRNICGIIVEPLIQGAAGMITQPKGFLKSIEKISRANGIPLIVDEVATGFLRTGSMFAFEQEKVKPDIIILGKSLTGGYLPLSCAVVNKSFSNVFRGRYDRTFFHGHTYAANPLACAAALETLKQITKKLVLAGLQKKIKHLNNEIEQAKTCRNIGDIRSKGLICGIELVQDKRSKKPFRPELRVGRKICLKLRDYGIITRPLGEVVIFFPPITITEGEITHFFTALRKVLNLGTRPALG